MASLHLVHDAREVLLQGLGVMGKVARHVAVEELIAYAQSLKQFGQDKTSHAVDAVHTHGEACLANSIGIDQLQVQNGLDMAVVETVVHGDMSKCINVSIVEVFALSNLQHLVAVGSSEELALAVEQLQGIPLAGIVRGCDDDAAVGTAHAHGQLGGRCRGIADVNDVEAHAHQGAANNVAHHGA